MITLLKTDAYKLHHRKQYPEGTEFIYSNLTPRNTKYFDKALGIKTDFLVTFGVSYIIEKLKQEWKENFFNLSWFTIESELEKFTQYSNISLRENYKFYQELHKYGELPLKFSGIVDGNKLKPNTPVMIFANTDKRFFWLVNYIETWLSAEFWPLITSANISFRLRELAEKYTEITCDNNTHVDYQFHDFSYRGLSSTESAIKTGMGHLQAFKGTDNLPAIMELGKFLYKNKNLIPTMIGTSIPATEHSVMCASGKENELETYKRLLTLYPHGLVSIVSDTWDIFNVCDNILPQLKDKILARNGKFVIRPDSGNPVEISIKVIQLLEKHFGSTYNSKGYKVLNPKIGIIYGDSITYQIAKKLFNELKKLKYASSNIVFGVGSYTYQYNTRDSFSIAVKSTAVRINGVWNNIQKNPITDSGKKSLTGFIKWESDSHSHFIAKDNQGVPEWLELL